MKLIDFINKKIKINLVSNVGKIYYEYLNIFSTYMWRLLYYFGGNCIGIKNGFIN